MKVALIGCGEIGPDNAKGLRDSRLCKLGPVMDLNERAARSLGRQFGVPYTTEIERILEDDEVEAAVVAVPHNLHVDVCKQLARAGKHVIVEKPIATTLEDTDTMIDVCRRAGVALSVLFSFRYEPRIQRVRELVRGGSIGDVIGTSIQFMTEKPARYWDEGYKGRVHTDWRGSWEKAGGGVLMMNVCHMLDYFRHITGLETDVVAANYSTGFSPVEVEDSISVSIRYKGGGVGSVHASAVARGERWRSDERIWGTKGSIILSDPPMVYTMRARAGLTPARWQRMRGLPKSNRVATYFDRLAESISNGDEPDVTGLDGRVNLALVLAAYESARTGVSVKPDSLSVS